ncbi:hypothetical protein KY363_02340 [Candidatus Woesearchaeota archaeon]|nr:hypothetical protein [Candidatus Woesearchaeota archaeon]
MEKIDKALGRGAVSAGLFLGTEKSKKFTPSLALLDLLGKASHRWVAVDDKAEWLFLCGRDVFASSVLKANVTSGVVLVANSRGEILGYGKITGTPGKKDSVFVKNLLDRGDFLRREMSRRKAKI